MRAPIRRSKFHTREAANYFGLAGSARNRPEPSLVGLKVLADAVEPTQGSNRSRGQGSRHVITPDRPFRPHRSSCVVEFKSFAPSLFVGRKLNDAPISFGGGGRVRRIGLNEITANQRRRDQQHDKDCRNEKNAEGRLAASPRRTGFLKRHVRTARPFKGKQRRLS